MLAKSTIGLFLKNWRNFLPNPKESRITSVSQVKTKRNIPRLMKNFPRGKPITIKVRPAKYKYGRYCVSLALNSSYSICGEFNWSPPIFLNIHHHLEFRERLTHMGLLLMHAQPSLFDNNIWLQFRFQESPLSDL